MDSIMNYSSAGRVMKHTFHHQDITCQKKKGLLDNVVMTSH